MSFIIKVFGGKDMFQGVKLQQENENRKSKNK